MSIQTKGQTHPGLVRQSNEDSFLVDENLNLYIVCDGVSGHSSGKVASQMTIETIQKIVSENFSIIEKYKSEKTPKNRAAISGLIERAINSACKAVFSSSEVDPTKKGMGTTVEVLLIVENYAILGHVGDSRIYLVRQDKTYLLTDDHTVPAEMVRQGHWSLEEAAKSPYIHTLTRAVGVQPVVQVDTLEVEMTNGDFFLLCSDGLSNYFKGNEISDKVKNIEFSKLCESLIQYALDKGGADNVTAVILKYLENKKHKSSEIDVIKKTEIFKQIPLFKYLNHKELNRILSLAIQQEFQKGTTIIFEGQEGNQIFIVVQGNVEIKKGNQSLVIKGKGEIIGEMSILDNSPRSASVITMESTSCLVISQKELFDVLRKDSQLAVKMIWALSQSLNQRLRTTTEQLALARADLEQLRAEPPFPQSQSTT